MKFELEAGKHLLKNEAYQEAVKQFTSVIEASPSFAEGYNQRAIAHFMLEISIDEAILQLRSRMQDK